MSTTYEIGLPVDLSKGMFVNTEYKNGALQLEEVLVSDKGSSIYKESGYWESEVVTLKDKIAAFNRISKNITLVNGATYKIYTSSSEDMITWTNWDQINNADGSILSPKNNYARIRIEIETTLSEETITVDDFTISNKYINKYVNSDHGVLELKKKYKYDMNVVSAENHIFSKTISGFKKIDKIKVMGSVK